MRDQIRIQLEFDFPFEGVNTLLWLEFQYRWCYIPAWWDRKDNPFRVIADKGASVRAFGARILES
jgi:hypothetical protein